MKIPPNNCQGEVWAGQKKITLPQNALVDLSTFTMDFKGYTQHIRLLSITIFSKKHSKFN